MNNGYTAYHVHTELSLLDSATKYQDYINEAVKNGQRSIAFTEHGNIFQWTAKKRACEKAGLKYIHGVECYLTADLQQRDPITGEYHKVRDNYHTVLLAKNYAGVLELNELVSLSYTDDHFYYKPRITFREFLGISDNIIKTSACLASPLNRVSVNDPVYEKLVKHYDYLEIQPHLLQEQIDFNRHLAQLSSKYHIPLIAGTDTHSLNQYKAECRTLLQDSKKIEFGGEDEADLTYKTYDQLVQAFRDQDALPEKIWLEAIENTNRMADSIEEFELDVSFKYPILYGEKDKEILKQVIEDGLQEKIKSGAVTQEQIEPFRAAVKEECDVFEEIGMSSFILFMSEMSRWCRENGIPLGFARGSVGGSRVAYLTDIIDLNPETWHTVFSRFANKDRKEIGDIDIDCPPSDRDRAYGYIIGRFTQAKTAFILAIGTVQDKGVIDEVVRAFGIRWDREHLYSLKELRAELASLRKNGGSAKQISDLNVKIYDIKKKNEEIEKQNPWTIDLAKKIKKEMDVDFEAAKKKYPDVFYYFDGLLGAAVSQSMHPAGIVASPITLSDHYGTFVSDKKIILQLDMDEVHEVGLVKYDILGLKNVEIIRDACDLAGIPYPRSHEIDWNDQTVWKDMLRSPVGIFEFEGKFAFETLRKFDPHSIFDMSMVTAAIRPSGASYRDVLIAHKPHKNPSKMIDDLLADNNGYLIYQEDTIKFLQQICGLSGSEADNIRRAIGRKQKDRLDAALPSILEGYCSKSPQPREVAEQEAKEFLQIIEDSASYQFG